MGGGRVDGVYSTNIRALSPSLPEADYATVDSNIMRCSNTGNYIVKDGAGNTYYFEDYSYSFSEFTPNYASVNIKLTWVEDSDGNWIDYQYESLGTVKRLVNIVSSDQREVTFSYDDDRIKKVVTNSGQIWSFSYSGSTTDLGYSSVVTYPDGSQDVFTRTAGSKFPFIDLDIKTRLGASYSVVKNTDDNRLEPNSGYGYGFLTSISVSGPEIAPYVIDFEIDCQVYDFDTDGHLGKCSDRIERNERTELLSGLWVAVLNVVYPTKTLSFEKKSRVSGTRGNESPGPVSNELLYKACVYEPGQSSASRCTEFEYIDSYLGTQLLSGAVMGRPIHKPLLTRSVQSDNVGHFTETIYSDFTDTHVAETVTYKGDYEVVTKTQYNTAETSQGDWLVNQITKSQIGSEVNGQFNAISQTDYVYNGHQLSSQTTDGVITSYTYNSDGNLNTMTLPSGQVNEYLDYYRGSPTTTTYAKGTSDQYSEYQTINSAGNITSKTNVKGYATSYVYDNAQRLIETNRPGYNSTTVEWHYGTDEYSNSPRWRKVVKTGGAEVTSYLDGEGREVRTKTTDSTEGYLSLVSRTYDENNNVTFKSFPYTDYPSAGISTVYDARGRITSVTNTADNSSTEYQYLANNQIEVTDAEGYQQVQTFESTGTLSNKRLISTKKYLTITPDENDALLVNIERNIIGNIEHISQTGKVSDSPKTYIEKRLYDSRNMLCKTIRPELGQTVFHYRDDGQLAWQATGSSGSTSSCDHAAVSLSRKTQYSYNSLGLVETIAYPDGISDKHYTYSEGGILQRLLSNGNEWVYGVNDLLMINSETLNVDGLSFPFDYTFDANLHVNSISYPDGEIVNYNLNALGWPLAATDFASNAQYHPNGDIMSFTYGNGIVLTKNINAKQFPEKLQYTQTSGADLVNMSYDYDKRNNTINITDAISSSNNKVMTYDGANQLKTASGIWGQAEFDYDLFGNISRRSIGNEIINYHYDTNKNRLANVVSNKNWSKAFSYDNRGNVINNGQNNLVYDEANNLVTASDITYTYDGYNRRVKKTTSDGTFYSVYNRDGKLLFRHHTNGETISSVFLGNQLIAEVKNNEFLEPKPERPVGGSQYLPYGKLIGEEVEGIGYTGHLHDSDLGLTYMQARYYDPVIGRFYSNDPVGALGHMKRGNPVHGFGRYTYANNNPYKYTDPNGEFGVVGALIGAAVETGAQLISNGGDFSNLDVSDIAVAAAVGAFTGGIGGRLASSAAKGTMSVSNAVTTTASVGGTTSGVGAVVAGELNGNSATTGQVGAAIVGGTLGAGAGAKIATGFAKTLEKGFGGLNSTISSTTRSGMVGDTVESGTSAVQRTGEVLAEAASNLGQKANTNLEEKR